MLNLTSVVWLTLAEGCGTLEEGRSKHKRTQSIPVDEIERELEKYIDDAQNVENISLGNFKKRLMIVNFPGEGETFIHLGIVTNLVVDRVFAKKIQDCVDEIAGERYPKLE